MIFNTMIVNASSGGSGGSAIKGAASIAQQGESAVRIGEMESEAESEDAKVADEDASGEER